MAKEKYPKCAICGKEMKEGYLFCYVVKGKVLKRGIKVCGIKCREKIDEKL